MSSHIWNPVGYHLNSKIQMNAAKHLLDQLHFRGNEFVIDVGCGDGKISALLADLVPTGHVVGTDISIEMIQFAKRAFPKSKHSNLDFYQIDAQQLNYSEEVDLFFSSFALQWLPHPELFFKRAYEGLRKSGYIACVIPLGISNQLEDATRSIISSARWKPYYEHFTTPWNFCTENQYKQMLDTSLFSILKSEILPNVITFESKIHFEQYVVQWFSYLDCLPDNLKKVFFNQVINEYIKLGCINREGKISLEFSSIQFLARKD